MEKRIRGVAMIIANPQHEILLLQEFVDKPGLGKRSGMFSIPMETSLPGEPDSCALKRLVQEELEGFTAILLPGQCIGAYRIVPRVWVKLYAIRTTSYALPIPRECQEVGNYRWSSMEAARALWLRQGAREMLEDYEAKRERVLRRICSPPAPRE